MIPNAPDRMPAVSGFGVTNGNHQEGESDCRKSGEAFHDEFRKLEEGLNFDCHPYLRGNVGDPSTLFDISY